MSNLRVNESGVSSSENVLRERSFLCSQDILVCICPVIYLLVGFKLTIAPPESVYHSHPNRQDMFARRIMRSDTWNHLIRKLGFPECVIEKYEVPWHSLQISAC